MLIPHTFKARTTQVCGVFNTFNIQTEQRNVEVKRLVKSRDVVFAEKKSI
jgi:hypothetical protein